jgi:ABC-2 type transport system ATP-binding protein
MNPVIVADKLSKWYGNILGVSEISLRISPGIKGLLGPNGAGKSTLLKILTGQLKANIGSVTIFGEPVWNNHALFRRIGYCPEFDSYYTEMKGGEFVQFLAELAGLDRAASAQRTTAALEQVGLLENRDKAIKAYSFGMRQRLRIAASIVHDPELLLLDEPLRGVDPLWRIRIIRLIKEYEKAGRTVIVSTHILPEIEAMTRDIILIHQGKVFAEGDIHYIRNLIDSHPHQVYVRLAHARELARELAGHEFVSSLEIDKDNRGITFKTSQRDPFFDFLTRYIADRQIAVEEISSPDDNLQAVFDYLIGR